MTVLPPALLESESNRRTRNSEYSDTKDHTTVQLSTLDEEVKKASNEHLLVVSPYDDEPHLLDLRTLDTSNQLLAKALVGLTCMRDDYATAPYIDIFNWSEVIDSLRALATNSNFKWNNASFYIVVFRSQIPPTTAYADLGVLDKAVWIISISTPFVFMP
jgi:hypothetical protein